jgi:CRP/FNR family transcriptional regulator/CRP/FNR family cyclic AMP-dependent transcriptional regulator
MYLLVSGQLNVSRVGPNGEEFVVDVFLPGDTCGEFSILDAGLRRIVDCVAVEPTACLAVSRSDLLAFLERNPRLALRMLAALGRHIREQDLYRSDTAFQNIAGRVARTLITLADSHGERVPDGVRIPAQISQTMLANMVGASRENVNRALARLVRLGQIRRKGHTITIPRLEDLRGRYSWSVPQRSESVPNLKNWRGREGNDPSVDIAKDADQRF